MTKNEIKLPVSDYVFEYLGEDITKVTLLVEETYIDVMTFKKGKKDKVYKDPVMEFTLKGINQNGKEVAFSFTLKISSKEMKNYQELTLINDKVFDREIYMQYGDKQEILYFDLRMFANPSSCFIKTLDDNRVFIKLAIPNELFVWFIRKI